MTLWSQETVLSGHWHEGTQVRAVSWEPLGPLFGSFFPQPLRCFLSFMLDACSHNIIQQTGWQIMNDWVIWVSLTIPSLLISRKIKYSCKCRLEQETVRQFRVDRWASDAHGNSDGKKAIQSSLNCIPCSSSGPLSLGGFKTLDKPHEYTMDLRHHSAVFWWEVYKRHTLSKIKDTFFLLGKKIGQRILLEESREENLRRVHTGWKASICLGRGSWDFWVLRIEEPSFPMLFWTHNCTAVQLTWSLQFFLYCLGFCSGPFPGKIRGPHHHSINW